MISPVPYLAAFDLGALSDQPAELTLAPNDSERAAITGWLGISEVEALTARIRISRVGSDHYLYAASFTADVVQACVVTLEPVRSHLTGEFSRRFHVMPKVLRRVTSPPSHEIAAKDDDDIEVLADPIIDVAKPVLEELSLALNPYPRAEGATFAGPGDQTSPSASPFAVLESFKQSAGKEQETLNPAQGSKQGLGQGKTAPSKARKQD